MYSSPYDENGQIRLWVVALSGLMALLLAVAGALVTLRPAQLAVAQAPGTPPEASQQPPLTQTPQGPEPAAVTRVPGLTSNLLLVAAKVDSQDLNDAQDEFVIFQFKSFVRDIAEPHGFAVQGYDTKAKVAATSAKILRGSQDRVLVGFPVGTDLRAYRIATVDKNVVKDESNQGNIPASVPLDANDALAGHTAAPELLSVRSDATLNRLTYVFTKELDPAAAPQPASFGFYTADGRAVSGRQLVTVNHKEITIDLPEQVTNAVRHYVSAAAVKDRQGMSNPPGAVGEATASPTLLAATRAPGDSQFDYHFSRPIENVSPDKVAVYGDDGSRYAATDWARVDSSTVRMIFPAVKEIASTITLATIDHDAVASDGPAQVRNSIAAVPVAALSMVPGKTSGPDLVGAEVDQAAGQVRYLFDEPVNDDIPIDAKGFWLVTAAGDLVQARSIVEAKDNWVLVNYNKIVVSAARGYIVDAGTIQDFGGARNPAATTMAPQIRPAVPPARAQNR